MAIQQLVKRISGWIQGRQQGRRSSGRRWWRLGLLGIGLSLVLGLVGLVLQLQMASTQPVDALLVLGGSINREIYAAEQAKRYPDLPILISGGSQPDCIWRIFQRLQSPMLRVWLENCADSTFDNFYFSQPILQRWAVKRVKVLTSQTHLPRAFWLAQIQLGAHGIWVDLEVVPETGVPGNRESRLKTAIDVSRSLLWAIGGQIYQPRCSQLEPLTAIEGGSPKKALKCEYHPKLKNLVD